MAVARALFRALIPDFVRIGYNATRMISTAVSMGIPTYRRQDMLTDIREFQGFFRREAIVREWDVNKIPHKGLMTETPLSRDRRYRVFADVWEVNTITGERDQRVISFYTDELQTFAQWEEEYIDMIGEARYRAEYEIDMMETRAIEHNVGWRY